MVVAPAISRCDGPGPSPQGWPGWPKEVSVTTPLAARGGLAAYRRLAEAAWARVPPLAPVSATRRWTAVGSGSRTPWRPWRGEPRPVPRVRVPPDRRDLQEHNQAYREAVGLLRRIGVLMGRLGRGAEFAAYVASVRAAHKPKRNFIALLDGTKWP